MKWKVFALLESSFAVVLSVFAIIFAGFALTAGLESGLAQAGAWLDIVLSLALVLVAHGQLIGAFRRTGPPALPRPGSPFIPGLVLLVFVVDGLVLWAAGTSSWTDFGRVFLIYSLVPPAALALVARVLVVWSTRRSMGDVST